MADNSTMNSSTDVIATDDVTTLNGNASSGVKVQRTKVGYGDDNAYRDVSTAFPLPVLQVDSGVTGTISAADAASTTTTSTPVVGQNTFTNYSGTPTASSFVSLPTTGASAFTVQITGTWVGTLQFERSYDGVNWHTVLTQVSGTSGVFKAVVANCSAHGNVAGATAMRVRATAWTSGTATVALREGAGTGSLSILSSIALRDSVNPATAARVDSLGNLQVNNGVGQYTTGTAGGNVFTARAAITTAATSVLQAAPAAGLSIYITDVSVGNSGSALSVVSLLPTAGTSVLDIPAAATGGGGSMNFQTPIKLAAATGLSVTTSAASTTVYVTVTGYIAP